jgi:hypothetical protein
MAISVNIILKIEKHCHRMLFIDSWNCHFINFSTKKMKSINFTKITELFVFFLVLQNLLKNLLSFCSNIGPDVKIH